jgi:hypothetical protein
MVGVNGSAERKVELFERGYGKDAAGIAREAINYGQFRFAVRWVFTNHSNQSTGKGL